MSTNLGKHKTIETPPTPSFLPQRILLSPTYKPSLKHLTAIKNGRAYVDFDKSLIFPSDNNNDFPPTHPVYHRNIAKDVAYTILIYLIRSKSLSLFAKTFYNRLQKITIDPALKNQSVDIQIHKTLNQDTIESFIRSREKLSQSSERIFIYKKIADLADITTALSFEALQQNTSSFSSDPNCKPRVTIKTEKIVSNLSENSRLSNKDSLADSPLIRSTLLLNGSARSECEHSEMFLETSLAELGELNIDYIDIWSFRIDNMENKLKRMFDFIAERAEIVAFRCFGVQIDKSVGECVNKSFSCLAKQAYGALKKLNGMREEKAKRVEEAQKRKDDIAKGKMGEMNEKMREKMDQKRREMLKKKSDLGLGVGTGEFYKKFCDFGVTADQEGCVSKIISLAHALSSPQTDSFFASLISFSTKNQKPRAPKGTRDTPPHLMALRDAAFAKIIAIFHRYGAVGIDTPIFEHREVLTEKYGEDSKLIYDLADQGGEALSLRYDLTVPFARYVATHGVKEIKRYHIGKVYRRDSPAVTKGKFREFYQCDFDIAGKFDLMLPDSEIIALCSDILSALSFGKFLIRVNHRALLDAIMLSCGVPESKFHPICSAIDKLDKIPWADVKNEMVFEKGLSELTADSIAKAIFFKGDTAEIINHLAKELKGDAPKKALNEIKLLFELLAAYGCAEAVEFDLTLARGLDYYTGVIFEAVLIDENTSTSSSIAGGGRYDNLIKMFSGYDLPSIGVSIGIERIIALYESKFSQKPSVFSAENTVLNGSLKADTTPVLRAKKTELMVAASEKNLAFLKVELCARFRSQRINCEFIMSDRLNAQQQINLALEEGCPFMVFVGAEGGNDEGKIQFKDMAKGDRDYLTFGEIVGRIKHARALVGEIN